MKKRSGLRESIEHDVAVMERLGLVKTVVDWEGVKRITLTPRGVQYVEKMIERRQSKPR